MTVIKFSQKLRSQNPKIIPGLILKLKGKPDPSCQTNEPGLILPTTTTRAKNWKNNKDS
jgi:hypothetical protein